MLRWWPKSVRLSLCVRFTGENVVFTPPPLRTDGPGADDDDGVDVNNPLLNFFFADTNGRIIINRKYVYIEVQKAIRWFCLKGCRVPSPSPPSHHYPGAAAEYTLITFNANTIATVYKKKKCPRVVIIIIMITIIIVVGVVLLSINPAAARSRAFRFLLSQTQTYMRLQCNTLNYIVYNVRIGSEIDRAITITIATIYRITIFQASYIVDLQYIIILYAFSHIYGTCVRYRARRTLLFSAVP